MLARACAAKTKSCFLKLAAPQLVQMFIGDGAKLVRDAFALAREKAPAIIFVRHTHERAGTEGGGVVWDDVFIVCLRVLCCVRSDR